MSLGISCARWLSGLVLSAACSTTPAPITGQREASSQVEDITAVARVLDDMHDAAAAADEARYFAHFDSDAVFLGTDAEERWNMTAFSAYAHPHFQKGKAWTFRSVRRAIVLSADRQTAWFDEDLAVKGAIEAAPVERSPTR